MRLPTLCPKRSLRGLVATMESLQNAAQRTVYLITYSRADIAKFPCKERFPSAILEAWNSCGIRVVQWVVCIEAHSNDCESIDEMNLYHYHMALKLGKKARWLQVRNYLDQNFGIQDNFSDNYNSYYTAYRYVTKEDKDALHSRGHPDLSDAAPRTERAISCRKKRAKDVFLSAKWRMTSMYQGVTVVFLLLLFGFYDFGLT